MDIKAASKTQENQKTGAYNTTPRGTIIKNILEDEQIKIIIRRVAKRNKTPLFLVQRKAKKVLQEMVSDLHSDAIKLSYRFFKFLWKKLYDNLYVDFSNLEKSKDIINNYPVMLIPSHKSHLDYLILSSVFHEQKLTPPFIAAGANMAFWPFGYIFRKCGAFFIRRSIANDILYYKILSKYISQIIKDGVTQEFFIEGSRSRNGKLQSPKLGLLTMQIDAFLDEGVEDLYFIPISIAYDRILEENAYNNEIKGREKAKESLWELIKSLKVLKSEYGDAHINFSEPISLKKHMQECGDQKLTPKFKKSVIKKLGTRIMKSINNVTPITTTSLIALILLTKPKKQISHDELLKTADLFISFFQKMDARFADSMMAQEKSILSGVKFLSNAGLLTSYKSDEKNYYRFKTRHRIPLDYYKNNIIHFCIPLFFISSSIQKNSSELIPRDKLKKDTEFLLELFAAEFFVDKEFGNETEKALNWLLENEIILKSGENQSAELYKINKPLEIGIFSISLIKYIEAYYLTARGILDILNGERTITETNLTSAIIKSGLILLRKGEISTREAITTPYINNALKYINKKVVHSLKSITPVKYLEEEDDVAHEHEEPINEHEEIRNLESLIEKLEDFMI